jgi:RHS repeat-associated protein
MTYNGLDQLVAVQPPTGNPVTYAYGYDGLRVLTTHPDSTEEHWFAEGLRQLGAERHHYVRAGSKTLARVTMEDTSAGGGSLAPPPPSSASRSWHRAAPTAIALALLALLAAMLRRRNRWSLAPAAAALLAFGSCGLFGSGQKSVWVHQQTLYFHHGVAPGPFMLTRVDATVFSERRYEPFGQPIDELAEDPLPGTGTQTGPIDFLAEPLNSLNKPTDPTTGFSYHGARWMASTTARWLTPDPPVKAPDPKFMVEPWGLHPYQYVEQNPVLFWDPDGREKGLFDRIADALEAAPLDFLLDRVPINGGIGARAGSEVGDVPLGQIVRPPLQGANPVRIAKSALENLAEAKLSYERGDYWDAYFRLRVASEEIGEAVLITHGAGKGFAGFFTSAARRGKVTALLGPAPANSTAEFVGARSIMDLRSRIPAHAERMPWKNVPGGAESGIRWKWTDGVGNRWEVRAHSIDRSAPAGSNAGSNWIYRVEVNPSSTGGRWYMDSAGNLHKRNIANPRSPHFDPDIANDTHIPLRR